ncbi:MAG: enoyl-CoA hydratase/isomerase family protein [Neisseriaceae bacterium]|nr:enoyl-CoA hydratase/isomerase family protein [Neisseriaceae bacterium]MBP6861157.1 enoyl-CoA hydratase/isomerase family protein [Neisseriaceae bacterium]
MYTTLAIEQQQGVATIWMDRPDVLNAFDETLIAELHQACLALSADDSVRVVVLAGKGRHFSAGADLNWMKRAAAFGFDENLNDARVFADMLHTLATLNKPTIARIQGAALGGGTGLAAACDMVVASDDAKFATSEVLFGIIPAVISPYVLRAIGPRHALRYFQTGERFNAQEALSMGLVTKVVALADLDQAVAELTDKLRQGGPQAQAASKALIQAIANLPLGPEACEATAQRIAAQRSTAEARDGISAFLDKRQPAWLSDKE